MRYPKLLNKNDTIGVCAPSSGVVENMYSRLDNAVKNVRVLGYKVIETPSVRSKFKCVSTDPKTRAEEFINLYENPDVAAIIPPWGGEFLMDILPFLDFERMLALPPKWVCGYSDLTTLTFPMTVACDIASIHGSNLMNMGYSKIDYYDLKVFEVMSVHETIQKCSEFYGNFSGWDISKEIYTLDKPTEIKSLHGEEKLAFKGRMIGGCMDVLCKLIGTRFAPFEDFFEKYKKDGFIWTLESCEMNAADIYRTLWQMKECGWFKYCNGFIIGRPDGYSDNEDFTLTDALEQGLGELNVPVIYGADIGHIPPQMQIVNGAYGEVEFKNNKIILKQELR